MQIHDIFERDIDRNINGVIQVGDDDAIKQELEEYVVTNELKRHFGDFFDAYDKALDEPTDRVGVWISGYFGSGKSHFLKMLSYLLENPEVEGKRAIEYFESKIESPSTRAAMQRASQIETESILFNVDAKGGGWKEGATADTALLRTFARVFYDHLGFFGQDIKLARFELMIEEKGGTEAFRSAYERIAGEAWVDDRDAYEFHSGEIAEAANEAIGLSAEDVERWVESEAPVSVSGDDLVADIRAYVNRRKKEAGGKFRLLFMVDEVGQFIGSNSSLMLNLQTIAELLGSECHGDAWVIVTSQEAIDEMRTIVENDFSKIQGRFPTRLSLSSSSVDEVIKRRILSKTGEAESELKTLYKNKSAVLRNLFSFEKSTSDITGYLDENDFVESYPFIGYQFTLMPQILNEIRRHGYSGKHLSTGERSMLSSFKESAQAIETCEIESLVPFWRLFDTVEKELDHGIKQVFERCRLAAERRQGLEPFDVDVLKTLYLVVYIPTQIETNIPNVATFMADSIDVDTLALKERVAASLDRLVQQNYVSREGQRYTFLTDQEQDVEREIQNTNIDSADVLDRIKAIVYDSIYTSTKLKKGANDFPVDRFIDDTVHGRSQNGMRLHLLTVAHELSDAADAEFNMRSLGQALIQLQTDGDYYSLVRDSAKVRKYANQINRESLSDEKRRFIERKQHQASEDAKEAERLLSDAIVSGRAAADGQPVDVTATTAVAKIDAVLDRLADAVFTKAALIDKPLVGRDQLASVLTGPSQQTMDPNGGPNGLACAEMLRYLEAQDRTHQQVNFGDLQRHFQEKPYGWRQDDIALILVMLFKQQKINVITGGASLLPGDTKLISLITNQSSFDKVGIRLRRNVPEHIVSGAKQILRELDPLTVIPDDEDGLVATICETLDGINAKVDTLLQKYRFGRQYPGERQVKDVDEIVESLLSGSRDPEAFLKEFYKDGDKLADDLQDLSTVEGFFSSQREIFDGATDLVNRLQKERAYFEGDEKVTDALEKMKDILGMQSPYGRIYELTDLKKQANAAYEDIVKSKRRSTASVLDASLEDVKRYVDSQKSKASVEIASIGRDAEIFAKDRKLEIEHEDSCSQLDALVSRINEWSTQQCKKVDNAVTAAAQAKIDKTGVKMTVAKQQQKRPAVLRRYDVCPVRLLESEDAVDEYVSEIREKLMEALHESGSVRVG